MRDDSKYYYKDKGSMMIFDSTVAYVLTYDALPKLKELVKLYKDKVYIAKDYQKQWEFFRFFDSWELYGDECGIINESLRPFLKIEDLVIDESTSSFIYYDDEAEDFDVETWLKDAEENAQKYLENCIWFFKYIKFVGDEANKYWDEYQKRFEEIKKELKGYNLSI